MSKGRRTIVRSRVLTKESGQVEGLRIRLEGQHGKEG